MLGNTLSKSYQFPDGDIAKPSSCFICFSSLVTFTFFFLIIGVMDKTIWGIKVSMITSRILHNTSVNSTITTIYLVTSALPMDGCNIAIVGENDIGQTLAAPFGCWNVRRCSWLPTKSPQLRDKVLHSGSGCASTLVYMYRCGLCKFWDILWLCQEAAQMYNFCLHCWHTMLKLSKRQLSKHEQWWRL